MTKSIVPNFRGTDYHHELSMELSPAEEKEQRAFAVRAVESYFFSGPRLHRKLAQLLDAHPVEDNIYLFRDETGGRKQIVIKEEVPDGIAERHPDRLWVRGDFFEHSACYLGVDASNSEPQFVNFKTHREEIASKELRGLVHGLNEYMDSLELIAEQE